MNNSFQNIMMIRTLYRFITIATIMIYFCYCCCNCDAYSILSTPPKHQISSFIKPRIQREENTKSYRTRSSSSYTTSTTQLFVANIEPTKKEIDYNNLSYGERSRIYRRDVFNYDAWVEHRSTDRFVGNIFDILKSGVFRQLLPNCYYTSMIALFVVVYNAIFVNGYDDLNGIHHVSPIVQFISFPLLKIPGEFFNLCTPSLALLLVFKTNTSYRRWDEGRKNWGAIVNSSRSILREGAAWIHECDTITNDEKQRLMERLEQAVWSFSRSLTRHLLSAQEDEIDYANDCREKLRPDLAEDLIAARHKPTRALYEVSSAINEFPIGDQRIVSMDKSTTVLCDAMGSSERIFTSPVPRFYTRHTSRFLELWLVLIPLALYEPFGMCWNHWAMVPATFIITGFLVGIDELALQLEEPFSVLPQHAITNNSIGKVLSESVMWRKTDYERSLESQQQQ